MKAKRVTMKQVKAAIRRQDLTECYKLCKLTRGRVSAFEVTKFIEDFASTKRLRGNAFWFVYGAYRRKLANGLTAQRNLEAFRAKQPICYAAARLHKELNFLKANTLHPERIKLLFVKEGARLYLASADYGAADYNKAYIMPIRSNERACDLLCKWSEKLLQKHSKTL